MTPNFIVVREHVPNVRGPRSSLGGARRRESAAHRIGRLSVRAGAALLVASAVPLLAGVVVVGPAAVPAVVGADLSALAPAEQVLGVAVSAAAAGMWLLGLGFVLTGLFDG